MRHSVVVSKKGEFKEAIGVFRIGLIRIYSLEQRASGKSRALYLGVWGNWTFESISMISSPWIQGYRAWNVPGRALLYYLRHVKSIIQGVQSPTRINIKLVLPNRASTCQHIDDVGSLIDSGAWTSQLVGPLAKYAPLIQQLRLVKMWKPSITLIYRDTNWYSS